MATLHMMCGLPGAGKTTLARRTELHFFDVPREVLSERLAARNSQLPPDCFPVAEAQLDLWWSVFEPPTADELVPAG